MGTALVTAPIIAVGKASTEAYREFDASMRNIQSISRQTDTELQKLGNRFLDMSRNLNKTTSAPADLAEAYYEIQSAAFYGEDAMKILEASTKAASAGLADQKETAKVTAMALHAYSAGAESATHYTDVMMRAVDIGIFRFEDLTQQVGDFIAAVQLFLHSKRSHDRFHHPVEQGFINRNIDRPGIELTNQIPGMYPLKLHQVLFR